MQAANNVNETITDESDLVEHLSKENTYLKAKCKQLEDRCRNLEKKLTTTTTNQDSSSNTNSNNTATNTGFETGSVWLSSTSSKSAMPMRPSNVYPPLKVRLQKLNEKSVALKWNHNPKNALVDLSGYNVYINNELLATMAPADKIASIDGMKEEGEYQIFIRAVSGNRVESDSSNVVITRVRKKPSDSSLSKFYLSLRLRKFFNLTLNFLNFLIISGESRKTSRKLKSPSETAEKSEDGDSSIASTNEAKQKRINEASSAVAADKLRSTELSPIKKTPRQTVASRLFKELVDDSTVSIAGSVENLRQQQPQQQQKQKEERVSARHSSSITEIVDTVKFSSSEPNLTKTNHYSMTRSDGDESRSPMRQSISLSDSSRIIQ